MEAKGPITVGLLSYEISPYRGSEASVSWNFVIEMSRYVHLIVFYGRFREELNDYLSSHVVANVDFVHIESPDLTGCHGVSGDIKHYLSYKRWHKAAAQAIGRYVSAGRIDIVHYLNPIGFKEPGYCWKIKGIPYIWGPVQGVDNRPLKLIWGLKKACL